MLRRSLVVFTFICAAFSFVNYAQTVAATNFGKVVLINSAEFGDEKTGIAKYVAAVRNLAAEFTPVNNELRTLNGRLETARREIAALRDQMVAGKVPVNEYDLQQKIDAADRLELEIKYRSEDAKLRFERRQQAMLSPVMRDIYAALQEFSKQKGFAMVFDVAKDQTGMLAAVGDEKAMVTKDFIAFYNARTSPTPK